MFKYALVLILSACSGYKMNNYANPLRKAGIERLKIEPFYNESNFDSAASLMTSEVYASLSEFHGLKLKRANSKADAVLIGIVRSPNSRKDSTLPTSEVVAQTVAPTSTSGRQDFNITATSRIKVQVIFYIVKDEDLSIFKKIQSTNIAGDQLLQTKSIFTKVVNTTATLRREIYDGEASSVNQTQNKTALTRKLQEISINTANQFKNALLYEI